MVLNLLRFTDSYNSNGSLKDLLYCKCGVKYETSYSLHRTFTIKNDAQCFIKNLNFKKISSNFITQSKVIANHLRSETVCKKM